MIETSVHRDILKLFQKGYANFRLKGALVAKNSRWAGRGCPNLCLTRTERQGSATQLADSETDGNTLIIHGLSLQWA